MPETPAEGPFSTPAPGSLHHQLHLDLERARLDSLKRIERNTLWTMVAVAAHAGVSVLPTVAATVDPAAAGLGVLLLLPAVALMRRQATVRP